MTIRAENLVKTYNKVDVVKEVNFKVDPGEIVGILGPNGAGKTTTFYMVVGIVKPNQGSIYLDQENITNLSMHKRARLGIGYLAQEASVFRKLTVEENILAILEMIDREEDDEEILNSLLDEFNIQNIRKQKGYTLSGGERRRVEIARALATDPDYILLDEPFAGVDPIAVSDIQDIVSYLKDKGLGVLITDHSVRETLEITDRAYIMHEGKILLSGTADEVANSEIAKEFYLGDKFRM
ncbi:MULTISPECIES: LPS export ABC transporter ATP-binding protein [unclassified Candidatus Frackibacter]|jgi:lipopolysaccharide export system ATP-binding protein|uniref:LPS export ABC transporter ATP-binding protein n=1 Tax=unclassified Candidatus Frackibacter TaxID=2648818 RepID=UPI00088E1189|nr:MULTISPECIES: LPS export ABC transporter ATP-binding protein [unclassified Candidatus Frackibacter]SDC09115.1 lipopolysaccharide export system ATP-binding protein [Candidatus Frackibacter sp. WG11]SEM37945.1 lipopolysaccharide export system ATP-binding protein [Candidatus Frackibacter sp. WG12]SFL43430.1 lipopolysaccharide export system ATP-binding protein [Candidatus Frackibacter sp. WG13]